MKIFIYLAPLFLALLAVFVFQNCKTNVAGQQSILIANAFIDLIKKYDGLKNEHTGAPGGEDLKIHFDSENTLGAALGRCNISTKEILINQSRWYTLSQTGKEVLLFHQLGICDLQRQLVDDTPDEDCPPSLMINIGSNISDRLLECYSDFPDEYHEELFLQTRITASVPTTSTTSSTETTPSTQQQQCTRIATCDVPSQNCQNGDKRPHRNGDSDTHHKWECHGDCEQWVECEKKMACTKQQRDDGLAAVGEKCLPTCNRFARSNTQGVTIGIGSLCDDTENYNILLIQGTAEGSSNPPEKCCRKSSKITCSHANYQHHNGNCFPNCAHAARLAGWKLPNVRLYDNGGGGIGGIFRPTTSDCEDLSYNGRTDWKDFNFYDPYKFVSSKNTTGIYLPLTDDKYGCCIRGSKNVTESPIQPYDSKGWHPSDY